MCQGPWIRLWTMKGLFCSISRVAVWFLLKKITKHASLLYLCIFQKVFEKARERSETESILWKLWDYRPSLASSEIQHIRFARILLKSLIAALKDKKQNQKAKTKTEHIKIIIVSIGVDIVAKTDDEIYALHIIKTYSFHLFSLLCQRSSCWRYRRWCSYFENPYHDAKINIASENIAN